MSSQQPVTTSGCSSSAVIEWLFTHGRRIESTNQFVHQLAHQLNDQGASIDRLMLSLLTLNPQIIGTGETWLKSTDTTTTVNASHGVRDTERFIGSPLQVIYETHKRVRRRLDNLPEDAHRAYTELAEDGFTDYLALPVLFGEVAQPGAAIIISTRQKGGFSDQDIESFRQVRDFLAPVLEVHALRHISRSLMNTYVGKRTSEKVLAGMIKRGDADVINAALWYSDLRNFTHLTETLRAEQILGMLNEYFEFISAAVTARGGEILRFIGDANAHDLPGGCQQQFRVRYDTAARLIVKRFQGMKKLFGRVDTVFKIRQLIQRFHQGHLTAFQLGQQTLSQFKLPQHAIVGIQQIDLQTTAGFLKIRPSPAVLADKGQQVKR